MDFLSYKFGIFSFRTSFFLSLLLTLLHTSLGQGVRKNLTLITTKYETNCHKIPSLGKTMRVDGFLVSGARSRTRLEKIIDLGNR